MADYGVSAGQKVVVIWDQSCPVEALKDFVGALQSLVGTAGYVAVENVDMLIHSKHRESSFDVVLSGLITHAAAVHSSDVLTEIARIMRPGGKLHIAEPVTSTAGNDSAIRTASKLISSLKLSGLASITEVRQECLTLEEATSVKKQLHYQGDGLVRVHLSASKPNYEVGSSTQLKLSFAKKRPEKPAMDPNAAKMWTLSAIDMNDDDVDIIDSDALLDDDDLKKPDPSSLRATGCGTGPEKKRKACKNCTCGLAEELEEKVAAQTPKMQAKSACGNCYLGDAFRCAGCPYMGMPAFKPGEKILLDQNQLNDV